MIWPQYEKGFETLKWWSVYFEVQEAVLAWTEALWGGGDCCLIPEGSEEEATIRQMLEREEDGNLA